jgi:hypothetical protein
MNTKVIEPKQGAATTADLSPQQQPQTKVVEQKPSSASSDEVGLAAGTSMSGLMTRRLWSAAEKTY